MYVSASRTPGSSYSRSASGPPGSSSSVSTESSHSLSASELPGPSHILDQSWEEAFSQEALDAVADVLPSVPLAQLKFLLEVNNNDADAATNLFLEGVSLPSLLSMLKSRYVDVDEVRRIVLEEYGGDPQSLAEAAVTFYKSSKFSPRAEVCISIANQPAMDAGGVRRQFMSDVLSYFATSNSMQLFEGPTNRLRPIFRQSSISSGLLLLIGKMVGHSIVLDGQGFPCLSPACYYYMAGCMEKAISVISVADAGERVQQVVSRVSNR